MIYGVAFTRGDRTIHTYEDWGLLGTSPASISPPEVQTRYITVPGMDGVLDATEALDGTVRFNAREFTAEYKIIEDRPDWKAIYTQILKHIHGRALTAVMDDDDRFYIKGRFTVSPPQYEKGFYRIGVTGMVDPYKYYKYDTLGEWEWDPFVFDVDVAWDYKDIEVDGTTTVIVYASPMPVIPKFICNAQMTLKVNGNTYTLPMGTTEVPSLIIKDDYYEFEFTGTGKVSIQFNGGML